jgi:hypothetical protein
MFFYDKSRVTSRKMTKEGFMVVDARVGRPGIQTYIKDVDFRSAELPPELAARPAGSTIKLLRPVAEVFNPESMSTFDGKPVTNNHPIGTMVDSTNVKRLQVGFSKSVTKANDGSSINASLVIQDKDTIREIEAGKDQISLGYDCQVSWVPGVDDDFGAFDGIQTNIHGNHIAIVDKARAGSDFRLNDEGKQKMKTRVFDKKSVELGDEAAEIFDALVVEVETKSKTIKDMEAKFTAEVAAHESTRGELAATKAAVITDEDMKARIDAAVKARVGVVDTAARVISGFDASGKSDDEIRAEVIKKLGDGKVEVEGKSAEYVGAVFDALVKTAKVTTAALGDAMGSTTNPNKTDTARDAMKAARGRK